jgi:hypothetical protein
MFILTAFGDAMLAISIAIFILNPWILLWKNSFTDDRKGGVAYIIHQILTPLAAILALIFAINFANDYVEYVPWSELGRVIISMIIQKFFTRVFMADTIYQMTEYDIKLRRDMDARRDAAVVDISDMETQQGNDTKEFDCEASNDEMLAQQLTARDTSSDVSGATDATDREKGVDNEAEAFQNSKS